MLIISVQDVFSNPSDESGETGDLLQFLTSKIPNIRVDTVSSEDVLNSVKTKTESTLYLTQDTAVEHYLRQTNNEVIKWKTLPDLSLKIDLFLQLHRHHAQFPLKLTNWRLKEVLHHSDHSIVYRATDKNGLDVAIKHFKFSPSSLSQKIIRRILDKTHQQCRHQRGLVTFIDGGISECGFYLVMEYLKFGTLRQTLDGCGNTLPLNHALEWFQEIAIALESVHRAGLIHRHLKIENILMRADGSLALLDYGISKRILLEAGYMHDKELFCSPHYVSPEQIAGDACTKATDIYNLGIIFYELLTGYKPYSAQNVHELMMSHVMAPIPNLPYELAHLQPLLEKMLAKRPEDRFSSAIDAIDTLLVAA